MRILRRIVYRLKRIVGWIPQLNIQEAEFIRTTKGMLETKTLRREIKSSNAPCGFIHNIRYFQGDELVREDTRVVVERGLPLQGTPGHIGGSQ